MSNEIKTVKGSELADGSTPSPVVDTTIPPAIVKHITSEINREVGKGKHRWQVNGIEAIFNHTPDGLVCRYCTTLNPFGVINCRECGLSHQFTLFVGFEVKE